MATLKHIADGSSEATDPFVITGASQATWGTGTRGVIAIVTAYSAPATIDHVITSSGVTWTKAVEQSYASRRYIAIFESDGTPSGGDITINPSGTSGSLQGSFYSVDEVAEWSGSGAVINEVLTNSASATALATTHSALTGDEIIYAAIGVEQNGMTNLVGDDEGVLHTALHSVIYVDLGAGVRHFLTIDASTDVGPGFTWTTTSNAGMVSARLSDGGTGTHDAGGGGGGGVLGGIAGEGGIAGSGGIAGRHGGIAG